MSKPKQPRQFIRSARARAGYFTGLLLLAVGLGLALGLGWGMVAAGVGVIAYFTLLYDVDEPTPYDSDEAGVRYR